MLSAEDRLDIYDLISRYNRAIDRGYVDEWVSTFATDGVFEGVAGSFAGAAELRAFANDYWSRPEYELYRGCQHWVNNLVIRDQQTDRATLACDHILIKPTAAGFVVVLMASYEDAVQRTELGWRFTKRSVRLWIPVAGGNENSLG